MHWLWTFWQGSHWSDYMLLHCPLAAGNPICLCWGSTKLHKRIEQILLFSVDDGVQLSRVGFWTLTWITCWTKHFVNPDKEQETLTSQALFYVSKFFCILWFKDWRYMQGFASWKSIIHFMKKKIYIKSFRLFWPTKTFRKQIIMHCFWWSCSWSN